MSKASDYAERVKEVNSAKPKFFTDDEDGKKMVAADIDSLGLMNTYEKVWTGEEALALAAWIIETFGGEGMSPERYYEVAWDIEKDLTAKEFKEGWHFCCEFDGLLVGPGMEEQKYCNCLETFGEAKA